MNELNLDLLNSLERQELLSLLSENQRREMRRRLSRYEPYPKQQQFHAAGKHNLVFRISGQGQFDTDFEVWQRTVEN